MGKDKSGIVSLLSVLVCMGAFFLLKKMFPALAVALLSGVILVLLFLVIVIAAVIVWAFRKPEEKESTAKEVSSLQKKGRAILIELRQISMRLKNQEIRKMNDEICEFANKIISETKNHQENLSGVCSFFDYYLPTLGKILRNYEKLESAGVVKEETTQSTVKCLSDIKEAMKKQYQNLFEQYELDMTVEMEVLNMICKRDGLIGENENDDEIKLTL